jgi:hypothetical protein
MGFRTPFRIGWTVGRFEKKGRGFFIKWLEININEELFSGRKIGGPSPLLGGLGVVAWTIMDRVAEANAAHRSAVDLAT